MRSKMHPFQRNLCSNIKWEKKKTFKKESNWTSADLMPFDRWKRERERENAEKIHPKIISKAVLVYSFCLLHFVVCDVWVCVFFLSYFYSTRLLAFTPFLCAMFFFFSHLYALTQGIELCVCVFFFFSFLETYRHRIIRNIMFTWSVCMKCT